MRRCLRGGTPRVRLLCEKRVCVSHIPYMHLGCACRACCATEHMYGYGNVCNNCMNSRSLSLSHSIGGPVLRVRLFCDGTKSIMRETQAQTRRHKPPTTPHTTSRAENGAQTTSRTRVDGIESRPLISSLAGTCGVFARCLCLSVAIIAIPCNETAPVH